MKTHFGVSGMHISFVQFIDMCRYRGGSENGLRAYFYEDCYLRFAGRPYDTHERKDAASPAAAKYDTLRHLTNNALVKYTTGVDVHETMWHSEEFSSYLQKNERFDFEHVQQQMKNIAKHALLSVQGKVAKSRPIEVR